MFLFCLFRVRENLYSGKIDHNFLVSSRFDGGSVLLMFPLIAGEEHWLERARWRVRNAAIRISGSNSSVN